MKWLILLLFMTTIAHAEQTKTVYNPFTGKLDYITTLSSTTLPSSSTNYIQNSASPTSSTQVFSVKTGTYSAQGFVMNNPTNRWGITISTLGALISTSQ